MLKYAEFVCVVCLLASGVLPFAPSAARGQTAKIQHLLIDDPVIRSPPLQYTVSEKLMPMWVIGLEKGDQELKCQLASSLILAHDLGITEFGETLAAVGREFSSPQSTLAVRLSMAKTLVVFDDRESREALASRLKKDGLAMAIVVEPALARWRYQPMAEAWLSRLEGYAVASPTKLRLAFSGLTALGEQRAAKPLEEIVFNTSLRGGLRIDAARAWGEIVNAGLEDASARLAKKKSPTQIDELAAVLLLRRHSSNQAVALLKTWGRNPNPTLAALALQRLLELNPDFVLETIKENIAHPDANIRTIAAHALIARPSEEHIKLLGEILNDPHPGLRKHVRFALTKFAQDENLRQTVIDQAMQVLQADRWAGLEQAILLLTDLDVKKATKRMAELLDYPRSEVFITAAWGLGRLRIADTIPALVRKAEQHAEGTRLDRPHKDFGLQAESSQQLAHIFEALGALDHKPAEPLMRRFIPKNAPYTEESRSAAIWALGKMYAGKAHPELTDLFISRFNDFASVVPEIEMVRMASAIALGRMKAAKAAPSLKLQYEYETATAPISLATGWAISEIENTEFRVIDAWLQPRSNWVLEPLE